jgi:hypothetical protein
MFSHDLDDLPQVECTELGVADIGMCYLHKNQVFMVNEGLITS